MKDVVEALFWPLLILSIGVAACAFFFGIARIVETEGRTPQCKTTIDWTMPK